MGTGGEQQLLFKVSVPEARREGVGGGAVGRAWCLKGGSGGPVSTELEDGLLFPFLGCFRCL